MQEKVDWIRIRRHHACLIVCIYGFSSSVGGLVAPRIHIQYIMIQTRVWSSYNVSPTSFSQVLCITQSVLWR